MINCSNVVTLNSGKFKSCGDLGVDICSIMSTDVSGLKSLKDFKDITASELVDVKGWKTMSSYPTLRLLYERYRNSSTYCDTVSSAFDYHEMVQFSELVGTYWVDLIEQVVPATTIWGSTYVYNNTLFDQQKFKYRNSTLLFCNQPSFCGGLPSPTSGNANVSVISTILDSEIVDSSGTTISDLIGDVSLGNTPVIPQETCNTVSIKQINCGSEFVGTISVIGDDNYTPPCYEVPIETCSTGGTVSPDTGTTTGDTIVTSCDLVISSFDVNQPTVVGGGSNGSATVFVAGANGPVTYLWSNGQTTQTATGLGSGNYTVTVTDTTIVGCTVVDSVILLTPQVAIGDPYEGGIVGYLLLPSDTGYNPNVQHGLIATEFDQSVNMRWATTNTGIANANGVGIGTGQANTNAILAFYGVEVNAANLCNDLVLNTYSDWYLPSHGELDKLRDNRLLIGNFSGDYYWSSTEASASQARPVFFVSVDLNPYAKTNNYSIRPVRSF